MAAAGPPWYHGPLSREVGETRLRAAAAPYAPGAVIYLVRQSQSRPSDYALQTFVTGTDNFQNLIITSSMTPAGEQVFTCSLKTPQPSFASLEDMLRHYQSPTSSLQSGPLTAYAPAAGFAHQAQSSIRTAAASATPPTETANVISDGDDADEHLRCEGYLLKIRGVGKNKKRFFRLTTKRLAYFSEEAGELIHSCPANEIQAVSDVNKVQIRLVTKTPFGSGSSASNEILLEAPKQRIKNKWLQAFQDRENLSGGIRSQSGQIIQEGYLTKIQSGLDSSKSRFFVLTDKEFAYYKEEGEELMASVNVTDIGTIVAKGDSREFKVIANVKFTVSRAFEVLLRADSKAVRNKWLTNLRKVIPEEVFQR